MYSICVARIEESTITQSIRKPDMEKAEIKITKQEAADCKALLAIEDIENLTNDEKEELGLDEDATLFSKTAKFDDGVSVEVKLCSGQTNCWAEAVWFDKDGYEICTSEPSYDGVDGSWECEYNDKQYAVDVIAE